MPLEPLMWKHTIPGLSQLEGLYLEFIEVHVPVLQSMPQLSKLRCALASDPCHCHQLALCHSMLWPKWRWKMGLSGLSA